MGTTLRELKARLLKLIDRVSTDLSADGNRGCLTVFLSILNSSIEKFLTDIDTLLILFVCSLTLGLESGPQRVRDC